MRDGITIPVSTEYAIREAVALLRASQKHEECHAPIHD